MNNMNDYVKHEMEEHEIEITREYIYDVSRHYNYTPLKAIKELIDNSIDAGATICKIVYKNNILSIIDDGCGMDYEKICHYMNYGGVIRMKTRKEDEIGRFGTGMKTSIIFLSSREGSNAIITTFNGTDVSFIDWDLNKESIKTYKSYKNNHIQRESTGTEISISNVNLTIKDFNELYKDFGVTYYSFLAKNRLKIIIETDLSFNMPKTFNAIDFGHIEIKPTDPLYSDNDEFILAQTNFETQISYDGKTYYIPVRCVYLTDDVCATPHPWDIRGGNDGGVKAKSRTGFYGKYSGRYVFEGDNLPLFGVPDQYSYVGCRCDFDIPQDLIYQFGVEFNKSEGIKQLTDPIFDDMKIKIKSTFNRFIREFQHTSKRKKAKEKNKEIKLGNREFLIKEKNFGNTIYPYDIIYEGKKTIVTLNTDSVSYKKIFKPSNSDELKNMYILFVTASAMTLENVFDEDKKLEYFSKLGENITKLL